MPWSDLKNTHLQRRCSDLRSAEKNGWRLKYKRTPSAQTSACAASFTLTSEEIDAPGPAEQGLFLCSRGRSASGSPWVGAPPRRPPRLLHADLRQTEQRESQAEPQETSRESWEWRFTAFVFLSCWGHTETHQSIKVLLCTASVLEGILRRWL